MDRRYRVLLIAEAANPEWTSVPLEGWSLAQALARVADVHLVTHMRNRAAIERAGLVEGRDFTALDNEYMARPLSQLAQIVRGGSGKGWTTVTALSALAYYSFEHLLWRKFGARIAAHEFDLVHRHTPLSPTAQSPIAKRLARCGVPFVLGPLNGGVPWPKGFIDRQHAEREWLSHIRAIYKLMPGYNATRRYSSAIIAGSKHTLSEMPGWAQSKCVYIPENGVDPARFTARRQQTASLPLKAVFIGRLVPYKGADILLEAAAPFLRDGQLQLHVVGDGPQKPLLESKLDALAIRRNVTLHGWVHHTDVQKILSGCDFMALPSVREFGGAVVVEAMAVGVMPVVADYAGPSELVDDATGIRVPFTDKASLIDGFRRAIGKLIEAPGVIDKYGAAARKKVEETLTWDAKARQILAVYDKVVGKSPAAG